MGIQPTRWIYGFQGVLLAQLFAFTPVAFLVLIGVVEGVSPTLEEASQTLRADRWATFSTVSLPLMRPGLANAFLVGFIESIADFGNPIVLGGDYGVLVDRDLLRRGRRAARLGPRRRARPAAAGLRARRLLPAAPRRRHALLRHHLRQGRCRPADAAARPRAPRRRNGSRCRGPPSPLLLYGLAFVGGFVEGVGPRLHADAATTTPRPSPSSATADGLIWTGAAWNSLWTTVKLAAIAAPLTAALGLLAAWLLVRQRFAGRAALEFATMLSFAVPGTVIGVAYVLAFNVPPIEITGTAIIIVLCFIFRNMPVGVRAGMAAMSQIDRSLDEASLTLRGRAPQTLRLRRAAAAAARRRRRPGLRLRARGDDGERRRLPGHRRVRDGHDLHHPARDQRRLRRWPSPTAAP